MKKGDYLVYEMCLIVDANVANQICQADVSEDSQPVVKWIEEKGGRIVYGGKLTAELSVSGEVRRWLSRLVQAGRAFRVLDDDVNAEIELLETSGECTSNDAHILALARLSGARVLYSNDQALHADFTNPNLISPRGRVYQRRTHEHLLRRAQCTG